MNEGGGGGGGGGEAREGGREGDRVNEGEGKLGKEGGR